MGEAVGADLEALGGSLVYQDLSTVALRPVLPKINSCF